jgi:photosystem II stability/assembly factor-like uncharacterized protein
MICKKSLKVNFLLTFLLSLLLFPSLNFAQHFAQERTDTTKEKLVQYRRGIELQEGYKSYDEKYLGINLIDEKRRLFPLRSTGIWTELNPKVPRVDYLGIQFVNKDTGWAVGDLGTLIKSTDGGTSWTVSETNTTTPILKVRSFDGQVVIASGFGGKILRSVDGGETFTQVTSNVTGDLWGLQMINNTLGWSCGTANTLIKTTDAGLTWQNIETPGYTSDYWWIDFLSESYGFIAANGKVLKTIDGGQNWEIIQAGDSYPLFSIDVIDSLHIAAAGYGGTGYPAKNIYSSDGGTTWITGGTLTTIEINCIKYISLDTGYVGMSNIGLWKTTNRGQNWTIIGAIGEYELQYFEQGRIGYNAGIELKLYKTEGNYDLWQRLIINDNFADVFFISEEKGFAISGILSFYKALYKTTNGGITWASVPGAPSGNDLLFLDSLTGYIGSNQIYKTTDGGLTWYVPNGGQGGAGKIFFINGTIGWAVRSNVIYKTTDRGENWYTQFTATSGVGFTSVFFIDILNGWVLAPGYGGIYNTTDGGINWIRRLDIPIYDGSDIYFNDATGFIINFLNLKKTTDSGNNWFTQFNSQFVLRNFGWLSNSHGFIVGDGVYETVDSGNTWNEILELRNIGLRKFHSPENSTGFAVGNLGLIYEYIDTTIIPVELYSFYSEVFNNQVTLKWSTATEKNNLGFEILSSLDDRNWNSICFINGNGTTNLIHHYRFTDRVETSGIYYYKLKQLDYNGDFYYSNIIEVNVSNPISFGLSQNFPNPFNNSTIIQFQLPKDCFVALKVYNTLGQEVVAIVKEYKQAGYYSLNFTASDISSGIYFYKLIAGEHISTKKFILLK